MRLSFLLILLLLTCALPLSALELTAVYPSTAAPGTRITLSGGPFSAGVTVLLAGLHIPPTELTTTRLRFILPALPSGDYAVAIAQGQQRSTGNFVLHVLQPAPRILSLSPTTIDNCAPGGSRQVTISGSHFQSGTELLLDNAAFVIDKQEENTIVFTLPPLQAGLHQIQVINPDNQKSIPRNLLVNSTPEVESVLPGDDRTIEYDLIINGKNFAYNAQIVVNGTVIGHRASSTTTEGAPLDVALQRDSLRYVDCSTLIYTRHPVIRDAKELTLYVVNPGSEQSAPYRLTAP